MQKKKVLLAGPKLGVKNSFYGDGVGGYTRNMSLYLREFSSREINIIPFFHTVRKRQKFLFFSFPMRMGIDLLSFIGSLIKNKPDAVHIIGQYRNALPREFAWSLICRTCSIPYVYEIKAGQFIDVNETIPWHNKLSFSILRNASLLLCEGEKYISYLSGLGFKSHYFPNVVAGTELPAKRKDSWFKNSVKILFVGYCYEGKGVFELIEGVNRVRSALPVELILVGKEHDMFSKWLEKYSFKKGITVHRLGKLQHKEVLRTMEKCDIYCYPTRHKGEGHNNTINEAMMNELIILCTPNGFLDYILEDLAFFIPEVKPELITEKIEEILRNKTEAIERARCGRDKLESQFVSTALRNKLHKLYDANLFKK